MSWQMGVRPHDRTGLREELPRYLPLSLGSGTVRVGGRESRAVGVRARVTLTPRAGGQPEAGSPASASPDLEGWLFLVQKGREMLAHGPQQPGPEPTCTTVQFHKTGS